MANRYNYTVLCFDADTNSRFFGKFYAKRELAEHAVEGLRKQYPKCRFTVAAVRV